MLNPNIKPTHKPIRNYYAELKEYERLGEQNEGTVRAAFQGLLQHYCHQSNLTLLCEKTHYTPEKRRITPDGEVVDTFNLPYGYWEAKDTQDDLYTLKRPRSLPQATRQKTSLSNPRRTPSSINTDNCNWT